MKISQYDFNQSLNNNLLFENKPKVAVATGDDDDLPF